MRAHRAGVFLFHDAPRGVLGLPILAGSARIGLLTSRHIEVEPFCRSIVFVKMERDFIARTPHDGAEFSLHRPTRSSRRTFRDSESEQERTWKKRRRLAAFEMRACRGERDGSEKRIPHRRSPKTGDRVPFDYAEGRPDDNEGKG
jgi:hypothetical protein